MASYLLVENKQIIHLGPIAWRPRFFQSELDDQEINFKISPAEPELGYVNINDSFEIFAIITDSQPEGYDPRYYDLAGPYYTYVDNQAHSRHDMVLKPISQVQEQLKQITMNLRYQKEIAGTKVTIQGTEVSVDTNRGSRDVFVQQYMLMPADQTTIWKFPEVWLTLTKADLGACVAAGVTHVQAAFNWESSTVASIMAASTMSELQALELEINPAPVNIGVLPNGG